MRMACQPQDVGNALTATNIIIPAGSVKIGNREYRVELNGSPNQVAKFNHLPVKVVNGTPIFLGEVAPVTDTHHGADQHRADRRQARDLYADLTSTPRPRRSASSTRCAR